MTGKREKQKKTLSFIEFIILLLCRKLYILHILVPFVKSINQSIFQDSFNVTFMLQKDRDSIC